MKASSNFARFFVIFPRLEGDTRRQKRILVRVKRTELPHKKEKILFLRKVKLKFYETDKQGTNSLELWKSSGVPPCFSGDKLFSLTGDMLEKLVSGNL